MEIKPEYYNEFNPDAAAWLRDLIKAGELPEGDVDERSIADLRPEDLKRYHRAHFFAGLGLWPYALRCAGFPPDERVWTGSCPCQPYSSAGKQKGEEDPRHLWPTWNRLIEECRPPTVFGEQVAAAIGKGWLDLVQSDLEREGYAVGKAVLSAASVGAPHIRQRLYFVADTQRRSTERRGYDLGAETGGLESATQERQRVRDDSRTSFNFGSLAKSYSKGLDQRVGDGRLQLEEVGSYTGEAVERRSNFSGSGNGIFRRAHDESQRCGEKGYCGAGPAERFGSASEFDQLEHTTKGEGSRFGQHVGSLLPIEETKRLRIRSLVSGFWGDGSWIWCRDQKYRPIEPSTFPLAYGLPRNLGSLSEDLQRLAEVAGLSKQSLLNAKHFRKSALHGYGNAIVPQVAAEFISAYLESR